MAFRGIRQGFDELTFPAAATRPRRLSAIPIRHGRADAPTNASGAGLRATTATQVLLPQGSISAVRTIATGACLRIDVSPPTRAAEFPPAAPPPDRRALESSPMSRNRSARFFPRSDRKLEPVPAPPPRLPKPSSRAVAGPRELLPAACPPAACSRFSGCRQTKCPSQLLASAPALRLHSAAAPHSSANTGRRSNTGPIARPPEIRKPCRKVFHAQGDRLKSLPEMRVWNSAPGQARLEPRAASVPSAQRGMQKEKIGFVWAWISSDGSL